MRRTEGVSSLARPTASEAAAKERELNDSRCDERPRERGGVHDVRCDARPLEAGTTEGAVQECLRRGDVVAGEDATLGQQGETAQGRVAIRSLVPDFRIEANPTRGLDAAPLGKPRANAGRLLAEYEKQGGVRANRRQLDDLVEDRIGPVVATSMKRRGRDESGAGTACPLTTALRSSAGDESPCAVTSDARQ